MTKGQTNLVPYRSVQRYFNESLLGVLLFCLAGAAFNYFGRPDLSVVAGLSAMVITSVLASVLAPYTGATMMPSEERQKRHTIERAEASIFTLSFSHAIEFSAYAVVIAFASNLELGFELEAWIVGAAFATGIAFGIYSSIHARRELSTLREDNPDPAGVTGASQPAQADKAGWLDGLAHHYLGYVLGITAGLLTASYLGSGQVAAFSLLIAFLITKLVVDTTVPSPPSNSPPVTGFLRKVMWVFIAFPAGIALWGIPIATLSVSIAHTYEPQVTASVLMQLFASVAVAIGAVAALMTAVAYVMNLVPGSESDTR